MANEDGYNLRTIEMKKRKVVQIEIAGDTIDAVSDITITNDGNVNIWNEFNGGGDYEWEDFVNCVITIVEI